MSYEYVVNPYTNRRVSIYSKTGQQVLNAYLEHLGGAGECAGHKNAKKCPPGCKKATYTFKKARGEHKRGDSYTYCTPEHHTSRKKVVKRDKDKLEKDKAILKADLAKLEQDKSKTGRKKKTSSRRAKYDPLDRHESRRRPGRRGDHEGLASLGYGGSPASACAGHKNAKKCPTGCKKATYTYRKARGEHKRGDSYTYCTPEHHSRKKEAVSHKKKATSSKKKSSSRSAKYDALDRHETRRRPGRRGDHEGLASLGYGGGYQ